MAETVGSRPATVVNGSDTPPFPGRLRDIPDGRAQRRRDASGMTSPLGPAPPDRRARLLAGGATGIAAMAILGALVRDRWSPLDTWVVRDAHLPSSGALTGALEAATGTAMLLATAGLVLATAAALRDPTTRGRLWRHAVLLAACAAVALTQMVFQRHGPPDAGQDWTYPSGHATVVTAVAVTAIVLSRRSAPAWFRPVLVAEVLAVLVTMACRVALGEHFPTDVLGAVAGVVGVGLVVTALLDLPARERPADLA
jgi:membrane-associated phospholipid phosphatase